MSYSVKLESSRDSSGNYNYKIFKNHTLVANYWHDFRGDEHGINFLNGNSDELTNFRMVDFLKGGGPQPLSLSTRAIEFLESTVT